MRMDKTLKQMPNNLTQNTLQFQILPNPSLPEPNRLCGSYGESTGISSFFLVLLKISLKKFIEASKDTEYLQF